jgi:uncharacterized membrane protein YedE/YeeE
VVSVLFGLCLALALLSLPGGGETLYAADQAAETASFTGPTVWEMRRWSPYVVGFGIGVLSWLAFLLAGNTLGASGSYAQTAGMIERLLRGSKVREKTYYREHAPDIGWGWMLLPGIVAGAFLSSMLSGDLDIRMLPPLWESNVGSSVLLRWLVAFAGGLLLGLGSRWAEGCTSGHGISGTLQLVVSSWIAAVCFFLAGVVTAHIIF